MQNKILQFRPKHVTKYRVDFYIFFATIKGTYFGRFLSKQPNKECSHAC